MEIMRVVYIKLQKQIFINFMMVDLKDILYLELIVVY